MEKVLYYWSYYSNANYLQLFINMLVVPVYYKVALLVFKYILEILFWLEFYKYIYYYYNLIISLFTQVRLFKGFIILYFYYLYRFYIFLKSFNLNYDITFILIVLLSLFIFFSKTEINTINKEILTFIGNYNNQLIVKKNSLNILKNYESNNNYYIFRSLYLKKEERLFKNFFKYSITLNNAITTNNVIIYILFLILNYIIHNVLLNDILESKFKNSGKIVILKIFVNFLLIKLFFSIVGNLSLVLYNITLNEIKYPASHKYLLNKCHGIKNPFYKGVKNNIKEHLIALFNIKNQSIKSNSELYSLISTKEENEKIIVNDLDFMDKINKINFSNEIVNWNNTYLIIRIQINDKYTNNLISLFKNKLNEKGKLKLDSDSDSDSDSSYSNDSDCKSCENKEKNIVMINNENQEKEKEIGMEAMIKQEKEKESLGEIKDTNLNQNLELQDTFEI